VRFWSNLDSACQNGRLSDTKKKLLVSKRNFTSTREVLLANFKNYINFETGIINLLMKNKKDGFLSVNCENLSITLRNRAFEMI